MKDIIKHEDLLDRYYEEGLPEVDFPFISNEKIYTFNVNTFKYLLNEYKAERVTDTISTINGSIDEMLNNDICSEGCTDEVYKHFKDEVYKHFKQTCNRSTLTIIFENDDVKDKFKNLFDTVLGIDITEYTTDEEQSDKYGNGLIYQYSKVNNILKINSDK